MVDKINIKDVESDVRDLRAESTLLSNVWKNLNGDITNIRSTLHTTANLTEKITKSQREIRDLEKEKLQIQKSLLKLTGYGDGWRKKKVSTDIKKIDDEIRLKQKSIGLDKSSIVENEQIDSLKQRYLKNQILISMSEWDTLHAVERKYIWVRLTLGFLEKTVDTYNELDKVVTKTRQTFGMLPEEGRYLFHTIKDTTIQMAHLGVTFEDVGNAVTSLGKSFTGIVGENKTLLETTVMLNKSFGISNETAINFSKTLAGISGTSVVSQQNMAGFAKNITDASGVPLDQLMSDVADASDDVRIFVGDSAVKMVKVSAEARMLGTNLRDAASTAKHFLNFESSINAELKASALLGRQINFNEARRMSFNKDTIGATKEILRLTKEVGFNQLNPIQQEAYAAAAGKSVTELQSMLQQEKNIQHIRSYGSEKDIERLDNYERMLKLSEDRAKDEGEIARLEMLRLNNQTKMSALQSHFNQFILELQEPILDIVEPLMKWAVKGMPLLISGIKIFSVLLSGPIQLINAYHTALGFIGSTGGKLTQIFTKLSGWFSTFGNFIGKFIGKFKVISSILPIFKGILKFIPGLGQIITGLTFIRHWFKDAEKFGGGFIGHLTAIPLAIVKAFLPFKTLHDWLDDIFIGKSPSKLGLGIVKGLVSIGPMLLDALIQPFIMGYNWIQNSFIGGLIPGGTIESSFSSDTPSSKQDEKKSPTTSLNDIKVSNEVIAQKIDELITLMANGGISVNLDGTRVNESLDTSRFNRGNRGIASSIS